MFSIVFVGYIQTIGNISAIIHLMDDLLLLNGERRPIKRIDVWVVRVLFPSQVYRSPRMEYTCKDGKTEDTRSQENN